MSGAEEADLERLEGHLETYFGGSSLAYHHDDNPADEFHTDVLIVAPSPELDHFGLTDPRRPSLV